VSWEVIIKPGAAIDIDEAFVWYEKTLDNLGFEFLLSIDATVESIKRNPEFASYVLENVRSAAISRFPFSVYYIIEKTKIFIVAVLHHSRNPEDWKIRL
jgi:toxin ParE1/3/4